ncbi:hypothetical protein [Mumia zhuanghuii]|uniref:GH26 domain-containing protein n=1 Tax=Mumia zhuanghuii TaxID=2585211 RepID=A0A5C4MDJ3_9ACTN|nr:hypothetical protein [Mumia zhuanghuii]TNC31630.1 hypothetical protein FHE65_31135 [Mumia zhuanghuii]TNC50878.1 hypothetical protein FHE65_02565 [Mumia zhuanghuii]
MAVAGVPLRRLVLVGTGVMLLSLPIADAAAVSRAAAPATTHAALAERKAEVRPVYGPNAIRNGSFERPRPRWKTVNVSSRRLTIGKGGVQGARRARLAGSRKVPKVVVASPTRRLAAGKGTRVAVKVWVRASRRGTRVRVVLRETRGKQLRRHVRVVRPVPKTWRRVSFTIRTRLARPLVQLRATGWFARRGALLLDGASARTVRSTSAVREEPQQDVDPYVGVLSNGCRYTRRGLPQCGAYVGAAHGGNSDPAGLEKEIGRRLGVRRTYYGASGVDKAVRTARADVAAGRLPWISFKLPHSWAAMANGQGDAWVRDLAERLDAIPGPVWLAFHHEPEGDGDVGAWRRMQERLAPRVRKWADNVAYTVILTGWNQLYGPAAYSLSALWPRGVKVDVAGFDVYNSYGRGGRLVENDVVKDYFVPLSRWASRQGVRWGLAETGYSDPAAERDPTWIRHSAKALAARGGVAFTYFDSPYNSTANWVLSTDAKIADFASALRESPTLPR